MRRRGIARGEWIATVVLFFSAILSAIQTAAACDLCSIVAASDAHNQIPNSIVFGVAEQFTGFDRLQQGGKKFNNSAHQHLESSITQAFVSYDVSDRITLQLTLPYINRRYKRTGESGIERGTEAGVGDLTLLSRLTAFRFQRADQSAFLQLMAGVKLPTGSSDRLKEELEEHHDETEEPAHDQEHEASEEHEHAVRIHGGEQHDQPPSVVHGHDLALGSGSVDIPLGVSWYAQQGRYFMSADVQYHIRTQGEHFYRYANDLLWSAGPGVYLDFEHGSAVGLCANLSGEYKGKDRGRDDERQDDTSINSLFLGPEITLTHANGLGAELALDLPLMIENSGLQAVPSYRIRAAVTYRF
jgi:hypothetical protein